MNRVGGTAPTRGSAHAIGTMQRVSGLTHPIVAPPERVPRRTPKESPMNTKLPLLLPLLLGLTMLVTACGATVPADGGRAPGITSGPALTPALSAGAPSAVPTAPPLLDASAPIDRLRQGGTVIVVRHTATDMDQTDSDLQNLENCQTQRNLTEQGRADARTIGAAVQALGIPVGEVLASPYCRTLETARLAFGRVEPSPDLLPTVTAADATARAALVATLRRLISTPPAAGVNTILVTHQYSVQDATGIALAEGEAAVFVPGGATGFQLVARIPIDAWATLGPTPTIGTLPIAGWRVVQLRHPTQI
jgi:phosphohistidine phosphatase SixA